MVLQYDLQGQAAAVACSSQQDSKPRGPRAGVQPQLSSKSASGAPLLTGVDVRCDLVVGHEEGQGEWV
jgi:hypothetical protein